MMKHREYKVKTPFQGAYLDMDSHREAIPFQGWLTMDNCHLVDGAIQRYSGWSRTGDFGEAPLSSEEHIIYGFDFGRADGTRELLVASQKYIYYYDRPTGAVTIVPAVGFPTGFSGGLQNRWQSAVLNDLLYLVNGIDPIQVYTDFETLTDLDVDVNTGVSLDSARYTLNCTGHLVLGYTTEDAIDYPRRVRWCKIGDTSVWTPDADTNDAGFFDLPDDIGIIQGMASLGPNAFVVYGTTAIYSLTYVGGSLIFYIERKIVGEGLFMPYSLTEAKNQHFFLGQDDFKLYSGGGLAKNIGMDKINKFFFSDFNTNSEANIFGFAHPIFPEIIWQYVQTDSENHVFTKTLIYNYFTDSWCTRSNFNFSMLCSYLDSSGTSMYWVMISGD